MWQTWMPHQVSATICTKKQRILLSQTAINLLAAWKVSMRNPTSKHTLLAITWSCRISEHTRPVSTFHHFDCKLLSGIPDKAEWEGEFFIDKSFILTGKNFHTKSLPSKLQWLYKAAGWKQTANLCVNAALFSNVIPLFRSLHMAIYRCQHRFQGCRSCFRLGCLLGFHICKINLTAFHATVLQAFGCQFACGMAYMLLLAMTFLT